MSSVIRAFGCSAWVAALACLGPGCVGPNARIEGSAMSPTLNDGERWPIVRIVDRLERGDIVVFYYPRDQSKSFVKRVIGLPGERITIRQGEVSVDGRRLDETYVATANRSAEAFEVVVPADEFFLMGDNRRNSSDSRHWGAVPKALIWAKVVLP